MTGRPETLSRPWCCPEPRCQVVSQVADADLATANPGESFSCFGRMPEGIAFEYDGSEHRNDLRSCHYTPLKGVIAYQENEDDWRMLARAYTAALTTLRDESAPTPVHADAGSGAADPPHKQEGTQ